MKFSYKFNPDKPYGVEMLPSMENYNTPPSKYENHLKKPRKQDFGFMEFFVLLMIIPFWIFIYKFFYLLVLPFVPVSVVVFEWVRELSSSNVLLTFGSPLLAAYLFYRGLKYLFSFISFGKALIYLVVIYLLSAWSLSFLLEFYPNNDVLNEAVIAMNNLLNILNLKISALVN